MVLILTLIILHNIFFSRINTVNKQIVLFFIFRKALIHERLREKKILILPLPDFRNLFPGVLKLLLQKLQRKLYKHNKEEESSKIHECRNLPPCFLFPENLPTFPG